eukprot:6186748-Pleurochrysis_carterae.AAC.2
MEQNALNPVFAYSVIHDRVMIIGLRVGFHCNIAPLGSFIWTTYSSGTYEAIYTYHKIEESPLVAMSVERRSQYLSSEDEGLRDLYIHLASMSSSFWLIVNSLSHGALTAARPHRVRQRASRVSARDPTAAAQRTELTHYTLHFHSLFPHSVARVDFGESLGAHRKLAWILTGSFSLKAWSGAYSLGRAVLILNSRSDVMTYQ